VSEVTTWKQVEGKETNARKYMDSTSSAMLPSLFTVPFYFYVNGVFMLCRA
jgi:hypothetical protein